MNWGQRILIFVGVVIGAGPVAAQADHQSHVRVDLPPNVDAARLFQDRLRQAQGQVGLAEFARQLGANGRVPDAEQLRKLDRFEPADRRHGSPPSRGRSGTVGSARASRRVAAGDHRRYASTAAPGNVAAPASPQAAVVAERPRFNSAAPAVRSAAAEFREQAARQQIVKQLSEWAERFPRDRLPSSLRDSPAVKDLFHRLTDTAADALRNNAGAEGWDTQLARWEAGWKAATDWLPKEAPAALKHLHLPDVSRFTPTVRLPQIERMAPTLSEIRRIDGSAGGMRTAANVLLGGVAVVVVLGMIWRLVTRRKQLAADGRSSLGPWPLDPARIATRDEVIQAFEYLSVLQCGTPARSWHHRAIADRLGGVEADRRVAAARLAKLYEQARYAPAAGSEPDWAAARGPLTLLARVP